MSKVLIISFFITAIILTNWSPEGFGQDRTFKNLNIREVSHRQNNLIITTGNDSKTLEASIDTLNFPLQGDYAIYFVNVGGYVSGNNSYGDLAKANLIENSSDLFLIGVLMNFAIATGGGTDVEVAVWDNTGAGNSPGTKLTNTTIPLDIIVDDVNNQRISYIPFSSPVQVSSSFYAGIYLPQSPGDTVALWTNTDGDTNPATAWELWNTNDWYPYDDTTGWNLKISNAIFPVVLDTLNLTAYFNSNMTNIQTGSSVGFYDISIGTPTSWLWEFQGGTPASSTDQNPVITYDEAGSFDVKLKVSDGETMDSLTLSNYITVEEPGQPTIDTLLYPLPGSYAIYIDNVNGGYVTGTNSYGDLAKANYFTNNLQAEISGVLLDFYKATGGNPNIEVAIWKKNANNKPGEKIGSTMIPLNTIKNDIANSQLSYVEFDNPVMVTGSFFAGFTLPQNAGDTLVVWSNNDGDSNPGIAWEQWNDSDWYPMNQEPSWVIDFALGIHPIVNYTLGIEVSDQDQIKVFPNPSAGMFYISVPFHNRKQHFIEVYNVKGKIIGSLQVTGNREKIPLDLSGFPNGIYFVKIEDDLHINLKKIIKK